MKLDFAGRKRENDLVFSVQDWDKECGKEGHFRYRPLLGESATLAERQARDQGPTNPSPLKGSLRQPPTWERWSAHHTSDQHIAPLPHQPLHPNRQPAPRQARQPPLETEQREPQRSKSCLGALGWISQLRISL